MAFLIIEGLVVLFDDEFYAEFSQHEWRISEQGYPCARTLNPPMMHQRIMPGSSHSNPVDHENTDKLDNRKKNLRYTTNTINRMNMATTRRTTKRIGKLGQTTYRARVGIKGKYYTLGEFRTQRRAQIVAEYNVKRLLAGLHLIRLRRENKKIVRIVGRTLEQ